MPAMPSSLGDGVGEAVIVALRVWGLASLPDRELAVQA
jgi:hypothetical protein